MMNVTSKVERKRKMEIKEMTKDEFMEFLEYLANEEKEDFYDLTEDEEKVTHIDEVEKFFEEMSEEDHSKFLHITDKASFAINGVSAYYVYLRNELKMPEDIAFGIIIANTIALLRGVEKDDKSTQADILARFTADMMLHDGKTHEEICDALSKCIKDSTEGGKKDE